MKWSRAWLSLLVPLTPLFCWAGSQLSMCDATSKGVTRGTGPAMQNEGALGEGWRRGVHLSETHRSPVM